MSGQPTMLDDLIIENLDRPLTEPVVALARQVAEAHGGETVAVLAYGSCLRDVALNESLIDYYVLTDSLSGISRNLLSRLLCRLVPPNVYYAEAIIGGRTYRAKYAAVPIKLFIRRVSPSTANPYFWARFAQPAALAYCRDEAGRQRVILALKTAAATAYGHALALAEVGAAATDLWTGLLGATYGSELRSEGPDRARQIVTANSVHYERLSAALGHENIEAIPTNWPVVKSQGKALSVLRLIKAAFTFQGGADYLAWKISRHSGQPVELTDWQRRHPILASLVLLPKLLRSGAIR